MSAEILLANPRLTGTSKVEKLKCQPEDDRLPAFSDEALAQQFAETHQGNLRYVAAWGKWLSFDGVCSRFDDSLLAFDRARRICRDAAAGWDERKIACALASGKTVAAVERLAKADRRLAATVDQWDRDPWLLSTPGGVIDLRTGKSRPPEPDDHMTKITAVAPGGACPIWECFIVRITNGDASLAKFLQRVMGCSLTGLTAEHALFFCYGTGANGKSAFTNTIAVISGEYHKAAPIETFVACAVDHHPTDLAGLQGSRVVTSPETEEGRRWAEAKIKAITGGDKITARFMRQDYFEFTPQFKLVIAGNHKPSLRSVDEATRRRMRLIPFSETIPLAERDRALTEKLKAEWLGVLAWMIDGCLAWQRDGLAPPPAVRGATAAYLETEDPIHTWIDDTSERNPQAWESSTKLFASWEEWAKRLGEHIGTMKAFVQQLESHGFVQKSDEMAEAFGDFK